MSRVPIVCSACGSLDRLRVFCEIDAVFSVPRFIAICYRCDDLMLCAGARPRRLITRLLSRVGLRFVEHFPRPPV